MKKKIILMLLVLSLPWLSVAQKNRISTIESTGEVPYTEDKSEKELKREALNQAILNGLQEEFGMVTYQGDKTSGVNVEKKGDAKTTQNFTWFAGTLVKGEPIRILQEKYKVEILPPSVTGRDAPEKIYRCSVKFTAREISESKPEFDAYTLWSLDKKAQTSSFINDDKLYLYFKSPSSGYLSIFLDDGQICQRLLPYKDMGPEFEDGVPVSADKEYYFFSNDNYFGTYKVKDNYIMFTDKPEEMDQVIIIFSKNPIAKPPLIDRIGKENVPEAEQKYLPRGLSSKDFEEWLIKKQSQSKDMAISKIQITISKDKGE